MSKKCNKKTNSNHKYICSKCEASSDKKKKLCKAVEQQYQT